MQRSQFEIRRINEERLHFRIFSRPEVNVSHVLTSNSRHCRIENVLQGMTHNTDDVIIIEGNY